MTFYQPNMRCERRLGRPFHCRYLPAPTRWSN